MKASLLRKRRFYISCTSICYFRIQISTYKCWLFRSIKTGIGSVFQRKCTTVTSSPTSVLVGSSCSSFGHCHLSSQVVVRQSRLQCTRKVVLAQHGIEVEEECRSVVRFSFLSSADGTGTDDLLHKSPSLYDPVLRSQLIQGLLNAVV